jgi:hypothetical protein
MGIYCGVVGSQHGNSKVRTSHMAASKRSRTMTVPNKILFCAAVAVATFVVAYPTGIYVGKQMLQLMRQENGISNLGHRADSVGGGASSVGGGASSVGGGASSVGGGASSVGGGASPSPHIEPPAVHRRTSNALDEASPPTQVGEYFRLYGERQRSLLAIDAANPNLEVVKHADDWKRAADWDQGFLRMQETFEASLDPAPAVPAFQLPPFQVPAFQVPAFQVPPVQMPALSTCCVAH